MSGFFNPTMPLAIPYLVALWAGWPDLEGVTVKDGPALADPQATEVLAAGWGGPAAGEQGDASGTFTREGLARPDREAYAIRSALAVLNGDGDIAAARARAGVLLSAAYAAVYSDHTLGGLVMRAGAGSWSMVQDQTDSGMRVTITFEITIDAYTRP
jgi:hypothetical protein